MTSWPLEIDGREYEPVPSSWIQHGHDDGQVPIEFARDVLGRDS